MKIGKVQKVQTNVPGSTPLPKNWPLRGGKEKPVPVEKPIPVSIPEPQKIEKKEEVNK